MEHESAVSPPLGPQPAGTRAQVHAQAHAQVQVGMAARAQAQAQAQAQLQTHRLEAAAVKKQVRPYHSRDTRDEIRRRSAEGCKALRTSALMQKDAPQGGGQTPSRQYCQVVVDNMHRAARGERPAYEALDHINRVLLADNQRCIFYHCMDPDAVENSAAEMHVSIYSTPKLLQAAPGMSIGGIDTKWRTTADGSQVQAFMALKQRSAPKPGGAPLPEFVAGNRAHDSSLLCLGFTNKDNYFSCKWLIDSVNNMLQCDNGVCLHRVIKKLFPGPDGAARGFYLCTECVNRKKITVPIMIDKARYEARAIRQLRLPMFLCAFHASAAQLKFCVEKLSILNSVHLMKILASIKFTGRGRSRAEVHAQWAIAKAQLLTLDLGAGKQAKLRKLTEYVEKEWLDAVDGRLEPNADPDRVQWTEAWTDILAHMLGRDGLMLGRTNNVVECFWLLYLAQVCNYTQFHRKDDEANAVTGCYRTLKTCLLDILEMEADETINTPTRFSQDMRSRTILANVIVFRGGVEQAGASGGHSAKSST